MQNLSSFINSFLKSINPVIFETRFNDFNYLWSQGFVIDFVKKSNLVSKFIRPLCPCVREIKFIYNPTHQSPKFLKGFPETLHDLNFVSSLYRCIINRVSRGIDQGVLYRMLNSLVKSFINPQSQQFLKGFYEN